MDFPFVTIFNRRRPVYIESKRKIYGNSYYPHLQFKLVTVRVLILLREQIPDVRYVSIFYLLLLLTGMRYRVLVLMPMMRRWKIGCTVRGRILLQKPTVAADGRKTHSQRPPNHLKRVPGGS